MIRIALLMFCALAANATAAQFAAFRAVALTSRKTLPIGGLKRTREQTREVTRIISCGCRCRPWKLFARNHVAAAQFDTVVCEPVPYPFPFTIASAVRRVKKDNEGATEPEMPWSEAVSEDEV